MNLSYLQLQTDRVVEELRNVTSELRRVQGQIDMLSNGWARFDELARAQDVNKDGPQFPYIPYDLADFAELMVDLHEVLKEDPTLVQDGALRPVRFLEVGCGMGRNLLLLKRSGLPFVVEGIELIERYLELGRQYFGLDRELIQHDALKFNYAPYDVVYLYRPFRDDALEQRLERRIISQIRTGAYVVSPLAMVELQPRGVEAVWDYRVWRKTAGAKTKPKKAARRKRTR